MCVIQKILDFYWYCNGTRLLRLIVRSCKIVSLLTIFISYFMYALVRFQIKYSRLCLEDRLCFIFARIFSLYIEYSL